MGLFSKGRPRSQSTSSVASQPSSQDTDDDALFLPTRDQVYLTHTKDGKPALGRKKNGKLLQDFGFDILGQSFGIPSRKDYQGHARRLSVASQSSGLITAQGTPRKAREAYTFDDSEPPITSRRRGSMSSLSTTIPMEMARSNTQGISNVHQRAAYSTQPSFLKRQGFEPRHIPPPPLPPPPPPLSTMGWRKHPVMNTAGVAPIPMNCYSARYQPAHVPSYSHSNAAVFQGIPTWANSQHYMAAQYPNHLGMSVPQPIAMPMLPHQQQIRQVQPVQIPQMRAMSAVPPVNMPPPPSQPPPQEWLQAYARTTGPGGLSRQDTKRDSNAQKSFKHVDQDESEDVRQRLSKRIRHVHVCAGCGKKRSSRYQRTHPLKRGEVPPLNYCYNCLKDAADTDCETSDGGSVIGPYYRKDDRETSVPWPSSDEGRTIADGEYSYEQSRHGPRWVKKSNRFGTLSKLFSRKGVYAPVAPSGWSASSAEQSRSRASSPVSELYYAHGPSRSSARRRHRRGSSGTVRQAKRVASPHRRRDSTDSWGTRHGSPSRSRDKKPRKPKNEDKPRTASNKKQATAQPRSRIPRPKAQARSIDTTFPPLADTDDLAHVFGSSLHLDTTSGTKEVPIPPRVEISSPPLDKTISDNTGRTMKQDTHDSASEGLKNCYLSPETTNYADMFNNANGLGVQAFMNESPRMPLAGGSKTVLKETTNKETTNKETTNKETTNKSTNYLHPNYTSTSARVSSSYSPRINLEQAFPSLGKIRRQPLNDEALKPADEHKAAFNWHEPLTPMDVPFTSNSRSPHVMTDSWSSHQAELEREAEEMAERDLAYAGKLFDSLSASLGGSATSAFPLSSFVTTSNMSIVSYNSDSGHSDVDIVTPIITGFDVEQDIEAPKPTPRIEFSSEVEQEQRFAKSRFRPELTVPRAQPSTSRIVELPDSPTKNTLYYEPEHGLYEDDYDVENYFPSPVGSSLVGHTGHSAEELVRDNTPADDDDNRPRGLLRLLRS
ncbi:hypothetical protein F5Y09DRAFT_211904 [Xylaria sp. FL1042]|nr:hypothetical protein F5Y09DRAFT_211904 [Xylaria sp. FL1042]